MTEQPEPPKFSITAAQTALYLVASAVILPIAVAAIALAIFLSRTKSYETRFPSPDGRMAIVQIAKLRGNNPNYISCNLYLMGATPAQKIFLGAAGCDAHQISWENDTTVNICDFDGLPGPRNIMPVQFPNGRTVNYAITDHCPQA